MIRSLASVRWDQLAEYGAASSDVGYGTAWRLPLDDSGHLGPAVLGLTHQMLLQRVGDYSLWWSLGSEAVAPSFLISDGMPAAMNYAGMLNGDWTSGTWTEMPVTIYSPAEQ